MEWIMFPQNLYFRTLNANVTILGDKAFKEVMKVKWIIRWALIRLDWCPYKKKRYQRRLHVPLCTQKKDHVGLEQENSHLQSPLAARERVLRNQHCQYFDPTLPASRIVWYLSHLVCGILLWQPMKTNADLYMVYRWLMINDDDSQTDRQIDNR